MYDNCLNKVLEIESSFDLEIFIYKGINIWPILRIELYWLLLKNNSAVELRKSKVKKPMFFKLKNLFWASKRFWQEIQQSYSYPKSQKIKGSYDILFLSTDVLRTYKYEGKDFNRIIDSISYFTKDYKSIVFETCLRNETKNPFGDVVNIDREAISSLAMYRLKETLKSDFDNLEPAIIALNNHINKLCKVGFDIQEIKNHIIDIFGLRAYFIRRLKHLKIKHVVVDFFYHKKALALISACKHLGVRTTEFQHGIQGGAVYSNWDRKLEHGFSFLPDNFWVWNRIEAKKIKWHFKYKEHDCIVGGDVFYAFYKKNQKKSLEREKNKILVTLQNLDENQKNALMRILIPVMLKLKKRKYLWVFRGHPEHKNASDEWISKLNKEIEVVYDKGFGDLFSWLEQCSLHITCSSSTVFEGMLFNVPSIIIDKNANDQYKELLKNNQLMSVDSPDGLLELIESRKFNLNQFENVNFESKFQDFCQKYF